jgi:hypothetical protein
VLAILAPSVTYNPTLAEPEAAAEIEQHLMLDPERGSAEWNSVWRTDIADLFDRETVQAAVDVGIPVRLPVPGLRYLVACDPSGGRGDSFTAAVGHVEGDLLVIDRVYERRSPFVSDIALDEVSALAREYNTTTIMGDNYGADLTVSAFARRGISYVPISVFDDVRHLPGQKKQGQQIKLNRNQIYLNALPLFTAGRVRLPDHPRLFHQLINLERRTQRSGHDSVDHPQGQHDDIANSVCACLVALAGTPDVVERWIRAFNREALPRYLAKRAGLPPPIADVPTPPTPPAPPSSPTELPLVEPVGLGPRRKF